MDLGLANAIDCLNNLNVLVNHFAAAKGTGKVSFEIVLGSLATHNHWFLLELYLTTLLDIVELYKLRGSLKEADYYMEQGRALSENCCSILFQTEFLLQKADLLYRQECYDESSMTLDEAGSLIKVKGSQEDGTDDLIVELLVTFHRMEIVNRRNDRIDVSFLHSESILPSYDALIGLQKGLLILIF